MRENHYTYFNPWESIVESNPQQILERKEAVSLGPLLMMQGGLDDNMLPAVQEKFAKTIVPRAARATTTCSRAPSSCGCRKKDQRPTARARSVKQFIAKHA